MSTRASEAYYDKGNESLHVFYDFMDGRYHLEVCSGGNSADFTISKELAMAIRITEPSASDTA